MTNRCAGLGWCVIWLAVACGESESAVETVSVESAPAQLAASTCDALEACGQNAALGNPAGSYDLCLERVEGAVNDLLDYFEADLERGDLMFSAAAMEACMARHAECADFYPDCRDFLQADREVDSICLLDSECGDGGYCARDEDCAGTCKRAAQEDEDCREVRCAADLYCGDDATCVPALAEGEDCSGGLACLSGLACVTYQDGADEVEVARCEDRAKWILREGKEGDACGNSDGLCEEGLICAMGESAGDGLGVCRAAFEKDGACEAAVPNGCPDTQYCDTEQGRCVNRIAQGEPCSAFGQCKMDLVCVEGECLARAAKRVGERCESDHGCASGNCDGGKCQYPSGCVRFSVLP